METEVIGSWECKTAEDLSQAVAEILNTIAATGGMPTQCGVTPVRVTLVRSPYVGSWPFMFDVEIKSA